MRDMLLVYRLICGVLVCVCIPVCVCAFAWWARMFVAVVCKMHHRMYCIKQGVSNVLLPGFHSKETLQSYYRGDIPLFLGSSVGWHVTTSHTWHIGNRSDDGKRWQYGGRRNGGEGRQWGWGEGKEGGRETALLLCRAGVSSPPK